MRKRITNYYRNDNNCYICPGMNDCVSVRNKTNPNKKVCIQKRLLLYTLRELYNNFKNDYAEDRVIPKFSFFASLRPPECVFTGAAGTHTICVCEEHENVKLKLYSVTKTVKYKDLIQTSVCKFRKC